MPLGDIVEGFAKFFGRLFIEIFLELISYQIGKIVLKILTFSRYPPGSNKDHCEGCVSLFGFIILIASILGLFVTFKS